MNYSFFRSDNANLYSASNAFLLAKFATACFIAEADGEITPEEKMELSTLVGSIIKGNNVSQQIRQEIMNIYNTHPMNFIKLEKYLFPLSRNELVSLVHLAEEMARVDSVFSAEEQKAIEKIRNYISDKLNQDFTLQNDYAMDLICTGCGGRTEINRATGIVQCPNCGLKRVLSVKKAINLPKYKFADTMVGDVFLMNLINMH